MIELKEGNTQRVGPMGEKIFEHWCLEVGANAHKADVDEIGIDYIVTFPCASRAIVALDLIEPEFVCRVQVKASDSPTDTAQMKLGKWLTLVNDPFPTFVILINYDRNKAESRYAQGNFEISDLPTRAFVMPTDSERIAYVLRTLRESETDIRDARRTIHALSGELIQPNGHAMRQAMRQHIGTYGEYASKKFAWRSSVGYKKGSREHQAVLTDEQLADFLLGLETPIALLRTRDTRFGITREGEERGVLLRGKTVIPPVAEVPLEFGRANVTAKFQTSLFHPLTVFPNLKDYRILLRAENVDFILGTDKVIRVKAALDATVDLEVWRNLLTLIHMFASGPVEMTMRHGAAHQVQTVTMPTHSFPADLMDPKLFSAVEAAAGVCEEFGKEAGPVDLETIGNAFEPIKILYSLVVPSADTRMQVKLPKDQYTKLRGAKIGVILLPGSNIGRWHFSAAVVVHGKVSGATKTVVLRPEIVSRRAILAAPDGEPSTSPLVESAEKWAHVNGIRLVDAAKIKLHSSL